MRSIRNHGLNRGIKNVQLRVVGHVSDIIFLEEIITLHYNFLQNERKVKIFFFPFPKETVFYEDCSYRFPQAI